MDKQVELAQALVAAGADIIQTEGGTSSNPTHPGTLGLIEKAAPTLAAAYEISQRRHRSRPPVRQVYRA